MISKLQLHLTGVFLRIFLRDRQSIFFSLFFPIIFMTVFGFANSGAPNSVKLGVVDASNNGTSGQLIQSLQDDPLFEVSLGEENELRASVRDGDLQLLLLVPDNFEGTDARVDLKLVVDAAQVRELGLIVPALETKLLGIERELRASAALFALEIEDVEARSQSYLAFLLPGLMAFTLMQLAIAGSGFNIVEYRRKGILKRLFVTPIRPRDFITAIVLARMSIILVQLSVLLGFATYAMDIRLIGSYWSFYFIVLLATFIFLCLGFCLGSIAKTQQSIMAIGNLVIFPQVFLSGIFYPIESMPEWIQPVAQLLPLSFVANALREIANNGTLLVDLAPSLAGIAVWFVIAFTLATRLFVWKEVAN